MMSRSNYISCTLFALVSLMVLACSGAKEEKNIVEIEVPLIPEGYEILATDTLTIGTETFVINALKSSEEDEESSGFNTELNRPLTILKGSREKGFGLLARNDSVILCKACGGIMGDPWDGLYTEENSFTVNHAGGSSSRWSRNVKFQYNTATKNWVMVSDRGASYSSLDPENTFEMTIYTPGDSLGLVPFESFKTDF